VEGLNTYTAAAHCDNRHTGSLSRIGGQIKESLDSLLSDLLWLKTHTAAAHYAQKNAYTYTEDIPVDWMQTHCVQ